MQEGIQLPGRRRTALRHRRHHARRPGLGNIAPEQGDYNQIVKGGGHGNYRTLVLAPASVQEMADFTTLAFDLADRYRNPVVSWPTATSAR
jgi:pyruvate/2-oxoacid:ferredoxin oxidoreductase alpha subunit